MEDIRKVFKEIKEGLPVDIKDGKLHSCWFKDRVLFLNLLHYKLPLIRNYIKYLNCCDENELDEFRYDFENYVINIDFDNNYANFGFYNEKGSNLIFEKIIKTINDFNECLQKVKVHVNNN